MAFVPGCTSDVFISYSHIDNDPPLNSKIGWVDIFADILRKRLLVRCSPKVEVFWDPQLRVVGKFSEQLEEALAHSAALICILTNPYLESNWCVRELREFMTRAGSDCIVKVEKSALDEIIDPEVRSLFDEIKDVLNCRFYEEIKDSQRYRDLMPDVRAEDIAVCYDKIDAIAQDLGKLLKQLRNSATARSLSGAAAEPEEASEREQFTVYLAETTGELEKERNDIRTELLQFNCRILPDRPLPEDREKLNEYVNQCLKESTLSIHLLGAEYGTSPAGETRSVPHIQYDLAHQVSQSGSLTQMVWTPEGISPKDDLQTQLLTDVRNATPEFQRTKIEDFKTAILEKIDPKNAGADEAANGNGQLNISLFCHEMDQPAVGPLYNHLTLNEFVDVNLQSHAQLLPKTDGVLLYYGQADKNWFINSWKLIQRQSSAARTKPVIAKAIYAGGPSTTEKSLLESDELLIIKNYGQFTPALLSPFLQRVREAKGDAR